MPRVLTVQAFVAEKEAHARAEAERNRRRGLVIQDMLDAYVNPTRAALPLPWPSAALEQVPSPQERYDFFDADGALARRPLRDRPRPLDEKTESERETLDRMLERVNRAARRKKP